jgi:hypothetical protein
VAAGVCSVSFPDLFTSFGMLAAHGKGNRKKEGLVLIVFLGDVLSFVLGVGCGFIFIFVVLRFAMVFCFLVFWCR